MSDFSKDTGGIESSNSTIAAPIEGDLPKSGIAESPKGELAEFGPGPGVGNTRGGIH